MDTTNWDGFVEQAPELAARIRGRFEANRHHVLGTIRPDGSPRLNGTEVTFSHGEVMLGMMPGSRKLLDVRRDPRVELHSAPLEDDLEDGDAKLSGRLVETDDHPAAGQTPGAFFRLQTVRAVLVHVANQQLVVVSWMPGRGVTRVRHG